MENKQNNLIPLSIIAGGVIIALALWGGGPPKQVGSRISTSHGVTLPVTWGDLGREMIENGTLDETKLRALYVGRTLPPDFEQFLSGENAGKIIITRENAPYLLNLLWGLGLSSKNEILEQGEMSDPRYGGPSRFASTAGWTLAQGSAMNHFSMHHYFDLNPSEQALVDKVSRDVYRPCCRNSAHFPDCNHGMAMLGLLELMASQGTSETEMRQAALAVNTLWFPGYYETELVPSQGGGCSV